MFVVLGYGPPPAAAAEPLPAIAVLPGARLTTLVVDLSASAQPVAGRTAQITVGGAQQQAQLTPVMSDRLAVAFVVDASETGRADLPSWLSAATRFILETPNGTRAAAVADTSPPTLISPPQRGLQNIVHALSGVQAAGQRRTSAALTLANSQFPETPAGNRVVVIYTTAPDAGGENAAALGARFQRAATILVAVGAAEGNTYWPGAVRATGGFFAPDGPPAVAPALDRVATTLQARYLVRFPTPAALPARASVRIDAGDQVLTGDVTIPAGTGGRPSRKSPFPVGIALTTIAGCLIVLATAVLLVYRRSVRPAPGRRRRRSRLRRGAGRRRQPGSDAARSDDSVRAESTSTPRWVVRGRASVPGSAVRQHTPVPRGVVRGRASTPGRRSGPPPPSHPRAE